MIRRQRRTRPAVLIVSRTSAPDVEVLTNAVMVFGGGVDGWGSESEHQDGGGAQDRKR